MKKEHDGKLRKLETNMHRKKAQSTLDHLLLATTVIVVLVAFTKLNGPFANKVEDALNAIPWMINEE